MWGAGRGVARGVEARVVVKAVAVTEVGRVAVGKAVVMAAVATVGVRVVVAMAAGWAVGWVEERVGVAWVVGVMAAAAMHTLGVGLFPPRTRSYAQSCCSTR